MEEPKIEILECIAQGTLGEKTAAEKVADLVGDEDALELLRKALAAKV